MDLGETVRKYIGFQMEIHNTEGEFLKGEIEDIAVKDNTLHVRFAWLGRYVGNPPWVQDSRLDYSATVEHYETFELGSESLCLQLPKARDTVFFFTEEYPLLNPEKILEE
jgi:hypothetical protein